MFTEVLLKKNEKRTAKGRKGLIWAGTIGVGILAFLLTWGLRTALEGSQANPLAGAKGVVYDQGMTAYARQWQATHQSGPVTVIAIKESTSSDLGEIPSFIPGIPGMLNFNE